MITRTQALILLAVSLAAVTGSQLLFKAGMVRTLAQRHSDPTVSAMVWRVLADPLIWLAIALVLVGVATWYLAMVRLPLSLMLPMAGIVAPLVSIGAYVILGEALTSAKVAAISVIAFGVAWLAWLSG